MTFRFALSVIALALAVPVSAQENLLSPAEFRDRVAASMAAETGNKTTVIDDSSFSTKDSTGQSLTLSVANAYHDYKSDPQNLTTIVARFVSVLGHKPEDASVDQLVVIVRPTNYLQQTIPAGGSTANFPASHPIAGDLAYFLAVDRSDSIQIATVDELKAWKLDEESAWKRAQSNLTTRMGPLGFASLEGEPGAKVLVADSGLAPSMLSDPTLCGPGSPAGLLAFVIERDAVLLAFPDDKASLGAFWKVAKSLIKSGQGLSSIPMKCADGQWISAPLPN